MPIISSFRNTLVRFANDPKEPAWARDLIAIILHTNGNLVDKDYDLIINEIQNNNQVPSKTVAPNADMDVTPRITLHELAHVSGVRALVPNQNIIFCPDYFTYIHGFNGSGKSSYYAILRNLTSEEHYPLMQNIYDPAPPAIKIKLTYAIDGIKQPIFEWDGHSATPDCLKYLRVFDKQIAEKILRPITTDRYEFHPFMLQLYSSIAVAVSEIERRLDRTLGVSANNLKALYGESYHQLLSDKLREQFIQELKELGLNDLNIDFEVCDVFTNPHIKLSLNHTHGLNEILSEGELKAVSLALFVAECVVNPVKNPIIIDDPVNSLDSRIIAYFIERLSKLENQIILFSHNMQMTQLFRESTYFKHYCVSTNPIPPNAKKQSFEYTLIAQDKSHVGYVKDKCYDAQYYLDEADRLLSANPFMDNTSTVAHLRKAVEALVDDAVFRGINPVKYRGHSNIMWDNIKTMLTFPPKEIDNLHNVYKKLSSGGEHFGYAALVAPLDKVALQKISVYLRTLMATYPKL